MKTITSFLVMLLGASCVLANEVSYDARTKSYTSAPESANSIAARQARASAEAAALGTLTQNRSNVVSKVNTALATFKISAIASRADVTLAWRTNVHEIVNTKFDNASAAQKAGVLLAAVQLYESLITLILLP